MYAEASAKYSIPEPLVVDARAKIIWGESPEKVLAFLRAKEISDKDAGALIEDLMQERSASIRADGIAKTWLGLLFLSAPIAYYLLSLYIGYWSLRFFAGLLVLGAVGLAKVTSGVSMMLKPRAVTGDLANGES